MKKLLIIPVLLVVLLGGVLVGGTTLYSRFHLHDALIKTEDLSLDQGTYKVNLEHDGKERTFYLYVPENASGGPKPLVILLHGFGGTGATMNDFTGIDSVADRGGFLVAAPNGIDRAWNDGRGGVGGDADKPDDVGFINALIDYVSARLRVDAERIYVGGMSNGATMANRLACQDSDRIAAIAMVSETAPSGFQDWCRPTRPVPLILFLSTDDPVVPLSGGKKSFVLPFLKMPGVVSVDDLLGFWARNNNCGQTSDPKALPDRNKKDDSRVTVERYRDCKDGAEIVYYEVEGAGHTWPGGKQYLPPLIIGTTNKDINASELIWQFFQSHPFQPAS